MINLIAQFSKNLNAPCYICVCNCDSSVCLYSRVDAGFDEHNIPMDVIWLDIEHTDGKR